MPNKKNIGAEIIVNLKEITNKDIFQIKKALNKYGMLYFKQQELTSKFYIQFAKYFGNLANYPRLKGLNKKFPQITVCLLYTSPSPRDKRQSRMPSSA